MKLPQIKAGFKLLTARDVSPGRAQGPLIPVELRGLFPVLPRPTAENPIPACPLLITYLDVDGKSHRVGSRYHQQTRSRHRAGETWVTGELGPFLATAAPGDMLFISANEGDVSCYRFDLFKHNTPEFRAVMSQLEPDLRGRWGLLALAPGTLILPYPTQIQKEKSTVLRQVEQPFNIEDPDPLLRESRQRRFVRDRGFHEVVAEQYECCCAVCHSRLVTPDGMNFEVEAAHIRPRGQRGPDDVRNGIALCRTHHWAFDCGIISIHPERRTIQVATYSLTMSSEPAVADVSALSGRPLLQPRDQKCAPARDALEWHVRHSFLG